MLLLLMTVAVESVLTNPIQLKHIGKTHTDIKHFRSYSNLETRDNGCGKRNFKSNYNETLDVHKRKHHTDKRKLRNSLKHETQVWRIMFFMLMTVVVKSVITNPIQLKL